MITWKQYGDLRQAIGTLYGLASGVTPEQKEIVLAVISDIERIAELIEVEG